MTEETVHKNNTYILTIYECPKCHIRTYEPLGAKVADAVTRKEFEWTWCPKCLFDYIDSLGIPKMKVWKNG